MNNQTQITTKITEAKNILITVGNNPSVDVLSAALGLTLAIDKMKKHSSAIFSGKIPSIMEFLHPEKTFENSIESFQDFIILLDKEKADKLRYKVEGDLVKIFITPYHTTISPTDLRYEQGDINVDLIIAIDAKGQSDIDKAAMAHGKILHSANIVNINNDQKNNFGGINFVIPKSSSYSEAIVKIITELDEKLLSKQISTALLTGIVVDTEQFSNVRTTPQTMTIASKLLSNGADQQLIVKEIRGMDNETNNETLEPVEIPEIGVESVEAESINESEPEVIETLDDYLPPHLPNFNEDLPPPPDVNSSEFSEVLSNDQVIPTKPEPKEVDNKNTIDELSPPPDVVDERSTFETQNTEKEKPTKVNNLESDPSQFHIPV